MILASGIAAIEITVPAWAYNPPCKPTRREKKETQYMLTPHTT